MIELRAGVVRRVLRESMRRVELEVELPQPGERASTSAVQAIHYPAAGEPRIRPGDAVLLNTTASSLGLGTGGFDFVVAVQDRPPGGRPPRWADRRHGHVMKWRYTPLQRAVLAAEEPRGPYHRALTGLASLHGAPVAVLELHSMVGPVAAAYRWYAGPEARRRVACVVTDSAALAVPVSQVLARWQTTGLVDVAVSAGQCWGGDLEAVHPASGLMVSRLAGADVTLVGPGPGVVGTGTALGTTALEVAALSDLAGALGGRSVIVPRISFADGRRRHLGLSHHTQTALGRLAQRPAWVVIPGGIRSRWVRRMLRSQLALSGILRRHHVAEVDPGPADRILDGMGDVAPTMGRSPAQDPFFFATCVAAGRLLARIEDDGCPRPAGTGGGACR